MRRVHLRMAAAGDRAATARAFAQRLATLDPGRAGAASQILLVRHMRDPLPGALGASAPAAASNPAWERAFQRRLEELRSSATRPERGRVDGQSDAVLFLDEAELVACLALVLCQGAERPWWSALAARYVPVSSLAALFAERPALIPATLTWLTAWGALSEVMAQLSEDVVAALLPELLRTYDLAELGAGLDLVRGRESGRARRVELPELPRVERRAAAAAPGREEPPAAPAPVVPAPHVARAPWGAQFSLGAPLPALHELFAGIAVTLQRAPHLLRRPGAAVAWSRFWRARQADAAPLPVAAAPARAAPRAAAPAAPHVDAPAARSDAGVSARTNRAAPAHARVLSRAPGLLAGAVRAPAPHARAERPDLDGGARAARGSAADPSAAPALAAAEADARGVAAAPAQTLQHDPLAGAGAGIATALGGIFYLVNLCEFLDLPACFEADCRLASVLGGWGTLEIVARALLAGDFARHAADPIWDVLAALDARAPGELPRAQGVRTDELRWPARWERVLRDGSRFEEAPGAAAPCALTAWGLHPALVRWAAYVAPYLRFRLARALDREVAHFDPWDHLLRLPAQLFVSATHVDIVASLEDVSLPARVSGLDRSPGWVRGLGRVLLVHFE